MSQSLDPHYVYNATINMFHPSAEPSHNTAEGMVERWGRAWGCDNDVGEVKVCLVHSPGDEFGVIDETKKIEEIGSFGDPKAGWYWQSDRIPPMDDIRREHAGLVKALTDEGVEVVEMGPVPMGMFKAIYTRDSAFAVPGGVIVGRMGPQMRHGEERLVSQALAREGAPILRTVVGTGMIEGGTFAMLDRKTAVIGRGIRANTEGCQQVAEALRWQGVETLVMDLPGYDIHIDASFLMIDVDLALVNPPGLTYQFLQTLKERKIRTIELSPEDDGWAVNGLAVRPGRVIMCEGTLSDRTREKVAREQVALIEIPYKNVQLNGGGIHCSTCPLVRDSVH